jgi:hypothetical protein
VFVITLESGSVRTDAMYAIDRLLETMTVATYIKPKYGVINKVSAIMMKMLDEENRQKVLSSFNESETIQHRMFTIPA